MLKNHSGSRLLLGVRRKLSCILILCAVIGCFLSGCSQPKDLSLKELLLEANAAHQEITPEGLEDLFMKRKPSGSSGGPISVQEQHAYFSQSPEPYDPAALLDQEQMAEDVTYLFDALYACYGNYEQMGGRAAFDAAEQAILESCAQSAPMQAEEFKELLLSQLAFVQDSHFTINDTDTNPSQIPFFFRETEFYKTDEGQYATKEGKTVAAVEGYTDLDQLFRRALSSEGKLVYYPVLLKDCLSTEAYASPQVCEEVLTVHYTDGSSETLEAEPYTLSETLREIDFDALPELYDLEGFPVLQINSFMGSADPDWQERAQEGARILGDSPIGILDLRFNPGGTGETAVEWLEEYAQTPVPTNSLFYSGFSDWQSTDSSDLWVENENLLIILTSKRTASAAEWLIDAACNLENVLIIGENTSGSMRGTALDALLKNSKLMVGFGMTQAIIPSENGYFEEYRGFFPDVWIPADEALEWTIQMLQRLG